MTRRSGTFGFVGAGLTGGAVFLVIQLVLLPATLHVPVDWMLRLIASLLAGPVTLTSAPGKTGAVLAPALAMHTALSLLFAYVLCKIGDALPFWRAIVVGAAFGLGLYMFNFYVMTLVLPWFITVRGGATVLAHVLFGATTMLAHKGLSSSARPLPPHAGMPVRQ
jgi:hypothetical protein